MYLQLHVFLLDLGVLAVCLSSLLNIDVCLGASQQHTTHPFRPKPAEHFSEPQSMVVIIAVVA
jgi:hypothetical protein